jgi:hypothetical protein
MSKWIPIHRKKKRYVGINNNKSKINNNILLNSLTEFPELKKIDSNNNLELDSNNSIKIKNLDYNNNIIKSCFKKTKKNKIKKFNKLFVLNKTNLDILKLKKNNISHKKNNTFENDLSYDVVDDIEDIFYHKYTNDIYNIHVKLKEYTESRGLNIYNKYNSSYNLYNYIMNNSSYYDKIIDDEILNYENDEEDEEDEED